MSNYKDTRTAAKKVTEQYCDLLKSLGKEGSVASEKFKDWFYQIDSSDKEKPVVFWDWSTNEFIGTLEDMLEYSFKAGYLQGLRDQTKGG